MANMKKLHVTTLFLLAFALCAIPQVAFAATASNAGDSSAMGGNLMALNTSDDQASASADSAATDTTAATTKKKTKPRLRYRVYVRNGGGWSKRWVKSPKTAGNLNRYKRLEGLRISFNSGGREGALEYRVYVSGKGWTKWAKASTKAKRIAKGKGIADIQLRLTDELADTYEILYRTHISGLGWQSWIVGPGESGSIDRIDRIDGVAMKLIKKKSKRAALKKAKVNTKKIARQHKRFDNRLEHAEEIASDMSSSTDYLITVDLTNHWLCVFSDNGDGWEMEKNWQVSNGRKSSPTVTGSFSVGEKGYSFGHGYTCYYYTQFYDDYLFHSVLYREGTFKVKDGRLGRYISAGCVRMPINRAKWIYNNIPAGTRVKIYN